MNHPSHGNAGSHIPNNLVWQECSFRFQSFLLLDRCQRRYMYFKPLRFFFDETSFMMWGDYSDHSCNQKKLGFCNLSLMNNVCASLLTPPSLLFMDHLFLSSFLQQLTKVSVIETLGRRPHLQCLVPRGAAPKLCPLPASTPTSPSEYVSQLVGGAVSRQEVVYLPPLEH